jgi:hypothetical protein
VAEYGRCVPINLVCESRFTFRIDYLPNAQTTSAPSHSSTPARAAASTPLRTSTRSSQSEAQSHPPQHHDSTTRSPIEIVPPSAPTSASMTPPAAHTSISPQSVLGGPSPTSALHPSNKLADWTRCSIRSLLKRLQGLTVSRLSVPPRLPYKADNNNYLSANRQVTFAAGSAGVSAGSSTDSEFKRGLGGSGYE